MAMSVQQLRKQDCQTQPAHDSLLQHSVHEQHQPWRLQLRRLQQRPSQHRCQQWKRATRLRSCFRCPSCSRLLLQQSELHTRCKQLRQGCQHYRPTRHRLQRGQVA